MSSSKIAFHQILEYVEALTPEEQELLISLVQKHRIENRRSEIAQNATETLEALNQGRAKRGSLDALRADLEENE